MKTNAKARPVPAAMRLRGVVPAEDAGERARDGWGRDVVDEEPGKDGGTRELHGSAVRPVEDHRIGSCGCHGGCSPLQQEHSNSGERHASSPCVFSPNSVMVTVRQPWPRTIEIAPLRSSRRRALAPDAGPRLPIAAAMASLQGQGMPRAALDLSKWKAAVSLLSSVRRITRRQLV